jgi:hypothetical protein
VLAGALFILLKNTYNAQAILKPVRPPEGREVITMELVKFISQNGLSPLSNGWIANRTDEKSVENFLPCLQYFLLNWTRIDRGTPLPQGANEKRPGIIITMQDDPLNTQSFAGYQATVKAIPAALTPSKQVLLSAIVLWPQ